MKENLNMKERRQRLIAVDKETGSILRVRILNYDAEDPKEQCILEHWSFYPRWSPSPYHVNHSISTGRVYQLLDKLDFYLTNAR